MNEKEIELIDGFFNKGWCCDLDEVYKAVMKLQNNWNTLKAYLNTFEQIYFEPINWERRKLIQILLRKMQELEQGKDE